MKKKTNVYLDKAMKEIVKTLEDKKWSCEVKHWRLNGLLEITGAEPVLKLLKENPALMREYERVTAWVFKSMEKGTNRRYMPCPLCGI